MSANDVALSCDMSEECDHAVTHIDNSGWVYCTSHGEQRRYSKPCRKLRPHELNRLKRGQQITRY